MDRWILILGTMLAAIGGAWGMVSVHRGNRSLWTVVWMVAVFICQLAFLGLRGKQHAACPLTDHGEILVFLCWALTLFYLFVGSTYRISLLGVFTAPVVTLFQSIALLPGVLAPDPQITPGGNFWHEIHSATAVLSYGGFALAAVAAVMFLVLDKQLKEHHLKSGLFRNLPPVRELLISMERLLQFAGTLLTLGIIAAFLMPHNSAMMGHLLAAIAVWTGYAFLLGIKLVRGLTGRKLSLSVVIMFILSLGVFAFV
jgi:ABC-type uncharacterized transport system permease subunit